ncbi:hypothetical protein NKG99_33455 [Mesorhizobium sp. M1409]|uniref:hypothetical protein n=1 Tax=unclassified Mesorhizobium TaxID=325217 RepID=UPI003336C3ED
MRIGFARLYAPLFIVCQKRGHHLFGQVEERPLTASWRSNCQTGEHHEDGQMPIYALAFSDPKGKSGAKVDFKHRDGVCQDFQAWHEVPSPILIAECHSRK